MTLHKDRRKARPDRAVRRGRSGYILCSFCNERLAELEVQPADKLNPITRWVYLDARFVLGSDGVYAQTSHNWNGNRQIRRLHKVIGWVETTSKEQYNGLKAKREPIVLPAEVRCPQCGELQELDPELLGVELEDYQLDRFKNSKDESFEEALAFWLSFWEDNRGKATVRERAAIEAWVRREIAKELDDKRYGALLTLRANRGVQPNNKKHKPRRKDQL